MSSPLNIEAVAKRIGGGLLPDNSVWMNRFRIESQTNPGTFYVIAQMRSSKVWGCSCRGWQHYRRCKHVADVLQRLARLADQQPVCEPVTAEVLKHARLAFLDLQPSKESARPKMRARILDL